MARRYHNNGKFPGRQSSAPWDNYVQLDRANQPSGHTSGILQDADKTLGNIDSTLAEHEAAAAKVATPTPGDSDDERLSTAAQKFANNEELNEEEARALKNRLDLEKPSGAPEINDQLNRGYTGKKGEKKTAISQLYHSDNDSKSGLKKKMAIAGAAAGGGVIGGVFVFLALLPLKIEHIVQNLESHFNASSENAVDREEQNVYSHYMQKYVLPGLFKPGCTSTKTDKNCVQITGCAATNPVCRVYQVWRQNKLEQTMADKYGLEFGNSHGRIFMKAPGLHEDVDVTNFAKDETGEISIFDLPGVSRTAARQSMHDALQGATLWDKALFRFKYGKFIEAKYGIKRCVIACKIRDNFADSIANKKQAAVLYTISHVIEPRSAALAAAMSCLMDPTCKPDAKSGDGTAAPDDPTNGEIQTEAGDEVEQSVDAAAAKIGSKTLTSLAGEVDKLNEAGSFSNYLVTKLVEAMGISGFTKEAMTKAIPFVGWINTAFEMVGGAAGLGPKVKDYGEPIKAAEEVEEFAQVETVASEIMTGGVDATEVGSYSDQLSNIKDATQTNEYQIAVEGNTSLKPDVPDKYSLNSSTSTQAAIEDVSGGIPGPVASIANLWNQFPGQVLSGASGLVCDIPGISSLCSAFGSLIGDAFKPIFTWLAGELFPAVVEVGPKVLGSTIIMPVIGGADIAYNAFAHNGLGGMALSATQLSQIQNQQIAQQKAEFDSMPMFARIFDTSTPDSLVSRLATDMPTDMLTATNDGLASVFTNPVSRIGGAFSSLFTKNSVFAATQAQQDPYDVTQYGYPANDPAFTSDPQAEWDSLNCSDTGPDGPTAQWNNASTQNPDTSEYENSATNPCLLIQASTQSACGMLDTSCLPPGSQNNGDSGATSTGTGIPTGTAQQLAQQISSSPNITFQTPQESNDFKQIIQTGHQTACGDPAISPTLLGVILAASSKYKLVLGVIDDGHSCGGPHTAGDAVDINGITPVDGSQPGTGNMIDWSASEQPLLSQFDGYVAGLLSANGGGGLGQVECFTSTSAPSVPSNVSFFTDSCDHQHVDVMKR